MSNKNEHGEEILPHNYDGIKELNNPLPRWWLVTFYATILFSVGYLTYYEILDGPTSDQALEQDLVEIRKEKNQVEKKQAMETNNLNEEGLFANSEMMEKGKQQYLAKCAACHGQEGQGVIGPNLTDKFWISSKGDLQGILKAIREGFPTKGMPPWKDLVPAKEQPYLAAFVKKLQGTKPSNPKAPQGNEI